MMTVHKHSENFLHLETGGKITTIANSLIATIVPDRPCSTDPKKKCYHLMLKMTPEKAQKDYGFYSNRFELTESAGKYLQELL